MLDVHSCARIAEAHDKTAPHRPKPISRSRRLQLWISSAHPPDRPFFLSKVGGTERAYMYDAGHTDLQQYIFIIIVCE